MIKIGDRVGLYLSETEKKIFFLGFGKYVGSKIPPHGVRGCESGLPRPLFLLDDGREFYSSECYYDTEKNVQKKLLGKELVYEDSDSM